MIVKHFGCTTIHNKALYKCIIHSFEENARSHQICSTKPNLALPSAANIVTLQVRMNDSHELFFFSAEI